MQSNAMKGTQQTLQLRTCIRFCLFHSLSVHKNWERRLPLHHIIGALDLVLFIDGGSDLWNLALTYLIAQYADRTPTFLKQAHASHLNLNQYKVWRLSVMLKEVLASLYQFSFQNKSLLDRPNYPFPFPFPISGFQGKPYNKSPTK